MTAWQPLPKHLVARLVQIRWTEDSPAPEAVLYAVAWFYELEEAPVSIRKLAEYGACGKTKAARIRATVETDFSEWCGTKRDTSGTPAGHQRDTSGTPAPSKDANIEGDTGHQRDTSGTPAGHQRDDRARDPPSTTTVQEHTRSPSQRLFAAWLREWKSLHPASTKTKATKDERRHIAQALEQASEAQLASMVAWAFHGHDRYARILQGLEGARGEEPKEYLGISTLFKDKKLATRLLASDGFSSDSNGGGKPLVPPPPDLTDVDGVIAWAKEHGIPEALQAIRDDLPPGVPDYEPQRIHLEKRLGTGHEEASDILNVLLGAR